MREQLFWQAVERGGLNLRPELEEKLVEWRGPTKEPFLGLWSRGWRKFQAVHRLRDGCMTIHFWMSPGGVRAHLKFTTPPVCENTFRRNPDVDIRRLERRAAGGDPHAQEALARARARLEPTELQRRARALLLDLEVMASGESPLADAWKVPMEELVHVAIELHGHNQEALSEFFLTPGHPGLAWVYTRKLSPWGVDKLYEQTIYDSLREAGVGAGDFNGSNAGIRIPRRRGEYVVSLDVYFMADEEGTAEEVGQYLDRGLDDRDSDLVHRHAPGVEERFWDIDVIGNEQEGAEEDEEDDYNDGRYDVQIVMESPFSLYHLFALLGMRVDFVPEPRRSKKKKARRRSKKKKVRRVRRNADEGMRQLGRAAAAAGGDPEALAAAARARRRSGEDVRPWELDPIGQVFHQAFLLGKEGRVEAKRKGGVKTGVERFYVGANRLPDRGGVARGPMHPFARPTFYDWRPWIESEGVVVVPQEPVQIDTNGPLDTLYKIAVRYNLTPDEVWQANEPGGMEWPAGGGMDPISVSGIHPYWTEWDEERRQGTRPPAAWPTGHYGAWGRR
jgi:hypothetical protein